jgi:aryl-alcohol dehydrogenase-like predicted oxidoreductase
VIWQRRSGNPATSRKKRISPPIPLQEPSWIFTKIPGTSIETTRLGFGTASLHHLLSSRTRRRLLDVAFDNGIRHFDTAPYYGHGIGEHELGRFVKRCRHDITLATKVGLLPNAAFSAFPALMYAAKAYAKMPWNEGKVGRGPRYIPVLGRRAADAAQTSLVSSLRRLRTDYLDLLLLHEPPDAAIGDELIQWFVKAKQLGLARALGIAGDAATALEIAERFPEVAEVLQVQDSLQGQEANLVLDSRPELQITYGYLRANASEESGNVMTAALRRNRHGVVLFSSRHESRIRENCRVAFSTRKLEA